MWKKAVNKKGFKVGGRLIFTTSDGRSVNYKINRSNVRISLKKGMISRFSAGHIFLPAIREEGEYQMTWEEESSAYRMESLNSTPFIQNRTYATSSYLLKGDEIFLDYNRLRVSKAIVLGEKEKLEYRWPQDVPFLIEGETGTGKTSLARRLHSQYCAEDAPFVAVNLSSFNPSLIESELFGHEKGSFTGAIRDKKGAVELAHGGTLFLDEIDSLELSMQVKLLTFLDDLSFRKVGGERELKTDCRIIFASGRSLKKLVSRGDFRADLLYRIQSGVVEKLTSLRDDKNLIRKELLKYSQEKSIFIDQALADYYEQCSWPGNYRQLYSHLRRKEMLHHSSRRISLCPLDLELEKSELGNSNSESLDEVKKHHCHKVFLESKGNYTLAAKKLNIAKNTLRKMVA